MKKLILLSALLIFACSSDDEGNDNANNPNAQRLVESITAISANDTHTFNSWFSYDQNNRLSTMQCQFNDYNEFGQIFDEGIIEVYNIEYSDNAIDFGWNDEEVSSTYLLNNDGTIDANFITFLNGYLNTIQENDNCLNQYTWVNNNLTQSVETCSPNFSDLDKVIEEFEYTNHINPIGYYGWILSADSGVAAMPYLVGAMGKTSELLPNKIRRCVGNTLSPINQNNCNNFTETEITYEFDGQGYPIVINANRYRQSVNYERFSSKSYAITYTN